MEDDEIFQGVGKAAYGFIASFLKEKKENLKKFFVKNKVGFLPKGMDFSDYKKLKNKAVFKQLKFLIKKHSTLSIILAGMYLSSISQKARAKCIDENRQRIFDKHGGMGVSILNMAITGFIEPYVKWLTKYSIDNNLSKNEIVDVYEENLKDWKERTIFIQSKNNKKTVYTKCLSKMGIGKSVFFMFASGSAIKISEETLKDIDKNEILGEYEYNLHVEKLNNNEKERVWIFEKKLDE